MEEQNLNTQDQEFSNNKELASHPGCSAIMQIMTFISALIFICIIVFILNKVNISASTLRTGKYVCFYLGVLLSVFFYIVRIYFAVKKDLLQTNYYKIAEFCKNPTFFCGCGLLSILYVTHSYHWYSVVAGIILIKISANIATDTCAYKFKTKATTTSESSTEQTS